MKFSFRFVLATAFAVLLAVPAVFAQADAALQASAQKTLSASRFKNVQVSVQGGIATLSGSVDLLDTKLNADKRVRGVKGMQGTRNDIQVAGPEISDAQLLQKVGKAIQYDRVGYRTTPFNSISVAVQDGVVTLGGYVYGPPDANSAVALVSTTKGVKGLVNRITVDPPSPMDDRIRFAAYRAIYGYSMLNKYAIDPGKPIRIQVSGGHITLYGVVDSQGDKNVAGIRANGVPGVFSVNNQLVVAGAPTEQQQQRQPQ